MDPEEDQYDGQLFEVQVEYLLEEEYDYDYEYDDSDSYYDYDEYNQYNQLVEDLWRE